MLRCALPDNDLTTLPLTNPLLPYAAGGCAGFPALTPGRIFAP